MTSTAEKVRAYQGPAILSYGFRPFFLAGAAWAAIAVAVWLPLLTGHLALPSAFAPLEWHMHELLYGYVPAVIAGFLLTAVPNWTGRLPVVGMPLLFLFGIWLIGRIAILTSLWIGLGLAAISDLAFLAALGLIIARELLAGKDKRNLQVLAIVAVLLVGNIVFHQEASSGTGAVYGTRIGIATTIFLIMLIGGRIIPSFTRNWLAKQRPGRLPATFDRFDIGVMAVSGLALASWVVLPAHLLTAAGAITAAILNLFRLARWAGDRTPAEPLVLILHIAFAFVPIGFTLLSVGIWWPDIVTSAGAIHAWTAGAIGLMTLSVMTRASLGHSGRALTATWCIQLIYVMGIVAACARVLAAFDILREPMLYLSAAAWVSAFAGFVVIYWPMLARRK